jgi:hypothetical protein
MSYHKVSKNSIRLLYLAAPGYQLATTITSQLSGNIILGFNKITAASNSLEI